MSPTLLHQLDARLDAVLTEFYGIPGMSQVGQQIGAGVKKLAGQAGSGIRRYADVMSGRRVAAVQKGLGRATENLAGWDKKLASFNPARHKGVRNAEILADSLHNQSAWKGTQERAAGALAKEQAARRTAMAGTAAAAGAGALGIAAWRNRRQPENEPQAPYRRMRNFNARLDAALTEFAPYGERTRDGAGRYIANETGGADPASMRQAYGPPQVVVNTGEKPRSSLKPGLIGAALGAGAMTKRGKRVIGAAGRMAVRGVRAVV